MEQTVKKRDTLFAKLQWEYNVAKTIQNRHPHSSEIIERLDKLLDTRSAFEEAQTDIEMATESLEAIASIFNHRTEFERIYYEIKTIYSTTLDVIRGPPSSIGSMPDDFKATIKSLVETQERFLQAQAAVSTNLGELAVQRRLPQVDGLSMDGTQVLNPNANVKLPMFTIPIFKGERKEWRTFKDLFETGIHNRENISNTLKLQYLLTYLDGEAKSLVSAYPITDANYEPAWSKLKEYYDKKKYVVYSLVREFVDQPAIMSPATGLRKLVTVSDDVIRQLKALGNEYESRDPWLIHLLLEKVDKETRSLWAQKVICIENPSFAEFLKFLQDRCDALEIFSTLAKKPSHTDPNKREQHKPQQPKDKFIQSFQTTLRQCAKCDADDHTIYNCQIFRDIELSARREFVQKARLCFNCLRFGHTARSCSSVSVCKNDECKQRHHTLLCPSGQSAETSTPTAKEPVPVEQTSESSTNQVVACTSGLANDEKLYTNSAIAILPTALVRIRGKNGEFHEARVLIDSGSQVSLVTQDFATRLGVHRRNARLVITGLSHLTAGTTKGVIHLYVSSRFSDSVVIDTDAYILGRLTAPLPHMKVGEVQRRFLNTLQLADPFFYEPRPIDVILGANVFLSILRDGQVSDDNNKAVAQNSAFGWILAGAAGNEPSDRQQAINCHSDIDIDKTLKMFWETEELRMAKPFTPEEQWVINHFESTYKRSPDGRFIVRLPFNDKKNDIGETLTTAVRRLRAMERRFMLNPVLEQRYRDFIQEYITLGHMERILAPEVEVGSNCFYLPHHAIMKEESITTKLRVVFDGSCSSSTGISLNEALYVGPNINPDLLTVLSRFRTYPVVFVADVAKMYRQVLVDRRDTDYQRIVWRDTVNAPIEHYRLLTVTYGTGCAAYLAIEAIVHAAKHYQKTFPEAAERIINDRYVDDIMSGADDFLKAKTIRCQISDILEKSGFHLRKWATNVPALLEGISEVETEAIPLQLNGEMSTMKTLGVQWSPTEDVFTFRISLSNEASVTKRQLLSESSRFFDPNGWLSPAIIKAKICYQQTWLYHLEFDDPLPQAIQLEWLELRENLHLLEKIKIPRWIPNYNGRLQLHGFSDASEVAYAAVVYARSITDNGEVQVQLFAAKTKLAPVKQKTLPRLELDAAALLADLMKKLSQSLTHLQVDYYAWTDSTIVLHWLSSVSKRWKTYVANRVSTIQEFLPRNLWNYVWTKENPADCASRGISPAELVNHNLWWKGPPWLSQDSTSWNIPAPDSVPDEDLLETRNKEVVALQVSINYSLSTFGIERGILAKFSRLTKALCVLAYVMKAFRRTESAKMGVLTATDLHAAEMAFIRMVQNDEYSGDIERLRQGKEVSQRKGHLKELYPFIDGQGVLRVLGRLQNSNVCYDMKHPIILPKNHRYTLLLLERIHVENLHCGPTLLTATLNQRFWIYGSASLIRQVIRNCLCCCRLKGQTASQLMGNLPTVRTTATRAFAYVGVDYAGPLLIKSSNLRGSKTIKGYISVFICLATKAIHLEGVGDLSTNSFLNALKRFVSRRGLCNEVWSDNGTNFVGANHQLRKAS